MEDNGVLPEFSGTAVHDCWSPYWHYDGVRHAVCNVHLLRELNGVQEFSPDHKWAPEFKNLLMDMAKAKEEAIAKGKSALDADRLAAFDAHYDQIIKTADAECPPPPEPPDKKRGRKKKGKERSLIERLAKLKDSVCLFVRDFKVMFSNNTAEQDVRNVKVKLKVAGCFRSVAGAQNYLDVMSYMNTGRKHGISVFDAMIAAFNGNAKIVLSQKGSE